MKKIIFSFTLVFFSFIYGFAQFVDGRFMYEGMDLPYKISFPDNYDKNKQYPLLVFLHGAGERGNDNEKQLIHGRDFILNNTKEKYPAIVIVPQCPETSYWSNVKSNNIIGLERTFDFGASDKPSESMQILMALINDWITSGKVDKKQVYAGGLSMGGMGTFELLWRMPDTFAAAFPICGGGDIQKVLNSTENVPLWIFHGGDDPVVPVSLSQQMYKALKDQGRDVKYTEYPGVGHDSWDNVFQEDGLFPWLFGYKKK